MVNALIASRSLYGSDIGGLLNHADKPMIADRAGAIGTGIHIGHIVADGAETQTGFQLSYSVG
jgi:hypothetical protein